MYFDGHWQGVYEQAIAAMTDYLLKIGLRLEDQAFRRDFLERMETYHSERDLKLIEHTAAYILRKALKDWGYPSIRDEEIRTALQTMYHITQRHWQIEDDAHPTLAVLRERGYRLALLSNAADDSNVQTLVDKAQLRSYFDVIYTSAAMGIRKPNPRFFEMALKSLRVPPWRAGMIGDMLIADILGAHNTGVFAIWITRRADESANHPYLESIHPDVTISSLSELPYILKKLEEENGEGRDVHCPALIASNKRTQLRPSLFA